MPSLTNFGHSGQASSHMFYHRFGATLRSTSQTANSHPPWAVPRLLNNEFSSILHLLHRIKQQKHLARKTLPTQKCEKRKQFQDSKNDYLTTNIHKSSLVLSTYLARRGTMTPTTTVPLRTSLLKLAVGKPTPKWRTG